MLAVAGCGVFGLSQATPSLSPLPSAATTTTLRRQRRHILPRRRPDGAGEAAAGRGALPTASARDRPLRRFDALQGRCCRSHHGHGHACDELWCRVQCARADADHCGRGRGGRAPLRDHCLRGGLVLGDPLADRPAIRPGDAQPSVRTRLDDHHRGRPDRDRFRPATRAFAERDPGPVPRRSPRKHAGALDGLSYGQCLPLRGHHVVQVRGLRVELD